MAGVREKSYYNFYQENENLIKKDSNDWWQTYREKFVDRFGSVDKRTRAMQALEKIQFDNYKNHEKNRFFEDVLKAAERIGDKTAETIGYKILESVDGTYYRQVVSSGKDLFKMPVDLFVQRMQEVWSTEETIRAKTGLKRDRQSDATQKPFKNVNKRFESKPKPFQRKPNPRSGQNERQIDTKKAITTGQTEDRNCYNCGKSGHLRKDCFLNKNQNQSQGQSQRTKPQKPKPAPQVSSVEQTEANSGNTSD